MARCFWQLQGHLPCMDGAACAVMPPQQAPAAGLGNLLGPRCNLFSCPVYALSVLWVWRCLRGSICYSGMNVPIVMFLVGCFPLLAAGQGVFMGFGWAEMRSRRGRAAGLGSLYKTMLQGFGSMFPCCAITLSLSFSLLQVL